MERIVKGLAIMAVAIMFCAAIEAAGISFGIGVGNPGYYDDCDEFGDCYYDRARPTGFFGIGFGGGGPGWHGRRWHHGWRH